MKYAEIFLTNETQTPLVYPLKRGVPLPPGAVMDGDGVHLRDAEGKILPSATKELQRRRDGSIEWLLVDTLVPLGPQESTSIRLYPTPGAQSPVVNPVVLDDDGSTVTLGNGISELVVSRSGGSLIRRLVLNGQTLVDGQCVDLEVRDMGRKMFRASLSGTYDLTILHQNALRTQIMLSGTHTARDGATFMDFDLRFTLTAGSPDLTIEHTFVCREDVDEKVYVRSMELVVPTTMDPAAAKLLRQLHQGIDWTHKDHKIAENVEVCASSVQDLDHYTQSGSGPGVSHPCAGGSVFLRNMESFREDWSEYPFHMRPGQRTGFRAGIGSGQREVHPILGWQQPGLTLVTTFEHFRQLHPKAISIDERLITYSIWPEWSLPMMLVRGVSKSHIIWLTAENRDLSVAEILDIHGRWEYGYVEPVDISYDPAWLSHCQVLDCHRLLPYLPETYPLLENLIEPVPSAGNPNRHTYDRHPATGMFHFGDTVNQDATSCNNNEDDLLVLFPMLHYLRSRHTYAWDYARESARHYMEVDFCAWSSEPRQHGGLIPHAADHFVGNVYPSHQWVEGLLAYYYLSGDERARHVVVSVADNHCWWACHNTDLVCCDGREAGVPLINLAAAYRLTREAKYLDAARHIIDNFYRKWIELLGELKYPYPVGTDEHPRKYINGYGDWSSFAGLYRLWEVSGAEEFRELGVQLLTAAIKPGSFSLNDMRGMDFFAAWALGDMTGDMDHAISLVESAIPMLLRRGGHPLRRLHFLKELHDRGLINDRDVGNRPGAI